MAGSAMTFTYDVEAKITTINIAWTSDDTTGAASGDTVKVTGRLIKGVTDPGPVAPTTLYDITITDPEGVNVLGNCGDDLADRSATATEEVYFVATDGTNVAGPPFVNDILTVSVAAAGLSTNGQILLYVDGYVPAGSE